MAAMKERDLEAGFSEAETRCGTPLAHTPPKCTTPITTPTTTPEREAQIHVRVFLPVITQREHFVAVVGESLSVGLGLGSAVGIWACINETLKPVNVHVANWAAGLVMGLFLAPFLDKAARLFFGKTLTVLKKPRHGGLTRFLDHVITVLSALVALGPLKGIQMQYAPFHTSLGFEYLVFVVGFAAQSFVKTYLYTIALSHDYERESIVVPWTGLPVELFWEYLDHFHHVFVLVSENLRDFLTFALYPYLMVLWIGHWETIDPTGEFAWVAHCLNIGFFFSFFSILKEVTFLVASPFWSADMPHHHHHSI
jgi:hypothetical protein